MDYIYKPTSTATTIIPLNLMKSYLRITHIQEDDKITDLINSSVDLWEQTTGYLLRAGTLSFTFSLQDSSGYDRRQEDSYARTYDSLEDNRSRTIKYFPPLSAKIDGQKPSAFSFFDRDNTLQTLTEDELSTLPDQFFFVLSEVSLSFMLKTFPTFPEVLQDKRFSEYTCNPIKLTVAIKDQDPITGDIKQCIQRIILNTYENPDTAQKILNDALIAQTMQNYNSRLGL